MLDTKLTDQIEKQIDKKIKSRKKEEENVVYTSFLETDDFILEQVLDTTHTTHTIHIITTHYTTY